LFNQTLKKLVEQEKHLKIKTGCMIYCPAAVFNSSQLSGPHASKQCLLDSSLRYLKLAIPLLGPVRFSALVRTALWYESSRLGC